MRTITLHIPEDIYSDVRQALLVRALAGDVGGTIADDFIVALFKALEEGSTDKEFKRRKEGDKR